MNGHLEVRFDAAMRSIYERAKSEAGYNAVRFVQMLNELGGLETAHALLHAEDVPEGYHPWLRLRRCHPSCPNDPNALRKPNLVSFQY